MLLSEKRDGTVKGRLVYNRKYTREWISREDSASPTVSTESILLTCCIDAHEGRDTMSADIPNAYIQTEIPPTEEGQELVIMNTTVVLVDMLI